MRLLSMLVVSIERLEQVNPIPHLPDYMLGLMRIRGELVPILDFEQILYGKTAKGYEDARVVVVQTGSLYIGLLVLDAKEILDIPESAIDFFRTYGIFKNTLFHDSRKFRKPNDYSCRSRNFIPNACWDG